VGVVVAPGGRLVGAGILTIQRGRITVIDLVADPERLRDLELAILDD
jgi:RNA polymerase sigma-70 factor (ECF subfamily)